MKVLVALTMLGVALAGTTGATGTAGTTGVRNDAQAAAAPPIDGKWTLTSEASQNGPSTLDLKVDGKTVTGTLGGPSGNYPIKGEYAEGKLTFSMDYQGQLTISFVGKPQSDGSLAGTMDYGQGPVNWKAVRVKAEK